MTAPAPIGIRGTDIPDTESAVVARVDDNHVLMMGDNPALPRMPEKPTLLDFFRLRFTGFTSRHLLISAAKALDDGHDERVVLACLLHDISHACLIHSDHGYWGAQLIAPYVDEEISWAVRYRQAPKAWDSTIHHRPKCGGP